MSKDWVNFEEINAAALAASPELLKKWLQGKAQKAIHKAAWLQERVRRTVVIAKPPAGQDFNDVLRAADGRA